MPGDALTLVTGGPGLIGSHVARALLARGERVRVTARPASRRENLVGLDVERVDCDLLDRRRVRRALQGVEVLYHCAGVASVRAGTDTHHRVNVDGTRLLLEEAANAGVRRVVQLTSAAVLGPAPPGETADERQHVRLAALALPHVDALHQAQLEGLRLAAGGLDLVQVCPTAVYGPGDVYRSSTDLVRRFLRRELLIAVDGTINVVDVRDVAAGMLTAAEHGRTGERYVLGHRNFPLERLFADLGRLSGIEPPAVRLPLGAAVALARVLDATPGVPGGNELSVRTAGQRWAFRSAKAKRELGWRPQHSPEETLEATIAFYRDHEPLRVRPAGTRQPLAFRVAGFGLRRASGLASRIM